MTMDWSNERYVRIYTRDTAEWLCLPWQSRAVWPLIVRKADRSGVIETKLGSRGVAALVALPDEVVAIGVEGLLVDGCLEEAESGYLIPNYLEAQETPSSDGQRQRESRERRRIASRKVTRGHAMSQNVTLPSRNVTESHAVSRGVTRGHEVSLLSDPDRTDPKTQPIHPVDNSDPPGGARSDASHSSPEVTQESADDGDGAETPTPIRKAPPEARGGAQGPLTREQGRGIPDPPEEALTAAYLLAEFVEQNHPETRFAKMPELHRERTILQWGEIVRKMHAIDRLEYAAITAMITWSQRHSFWKTRITTAKALRESWDTMASQRKHKAAVASATKLADETPEQVKARRAREAERQRAADDEQRAKDARAAEERAEVIAATAELKQKLGAA